METENKNEIVVNRGVEVSTDLFGESRSKKITSLDLTDEKQSTWFINSQTEADHKLNECAGQVITFVGATIGEYPYEVMDEETEELVTRKKHTLCLFDENGESYVTGSNSCYYSFATIVALKGLPTVDNPLKLEIVKAPAETKGHEYLKVKIAK